MVKKDEVTQPTAQDGFLAANDAARSFSSTTPKPDEKLLAAWKAAPLQKKVVHVVLVFCYMFLKVPLDFSRTP